MALLHDCGKIGVPDNILGKPGKLSEEEFEIIKSHTVRGGQILSNFKSLEDANEGALYHHERYDGRGYPEGKAGEDIPLIARMICVADSFDAMNTNRVYRKMLSKEKIVSEIETNKGKQFDPRFADAMLRLIKERKIVMED
jgi:HD-GYP domain-containing protein (c-di-GMP phosphodiesterase class II)